MDKDKLDNTRRTMAFAETTLPGHSSSTKVYKDQCLYCFRTPVTSQEEADSLSSTEGLYLSLSCFHSACRAHLATLAAVTSSTVFLHIKVPPTTPPPSHTHTLSHHIPTHHPPPSTYPPLQPPPHTH